MFRTHTLRRTLRRLAKIHLKSNLRKRNRTLNFIVPFRSLRAHTASIALKRLYADARHRQLNTEERGARRGGNIRCGMVLTLLDNFDTAWQFWHCYENKKSCMLLSILLDTAWLYQLWHCFAWNCLTLRGYISYGTAWQRLTRLTALPAWHVWYCLTLLGFRCGTRRRALHVQVSRSPYCIYGICIPKCIWYTRISVSIDALFGRAFGYYAGPSVSMVYTPLFTVPLVTVQPLLYL